MFRKSFGTAGINGNKFFIYQRSNFSDSGWPTVVNTVPVITFLTVSNEKFGEGGNCPQFTCDILDSSRRLLNNPPIDKSSIDLKQCASDLVIYIFATERHDVYKRYVKKIGEH